MLKDLRLFLVAIIAIHLKGVSHYSVTWLQKQYDLLEKRGSEWVMESIGQTGWYVLSLYVLYIKMGGSQHELQTLIIP